MSDFSVPVPPPPPPQRGPSGMPTTFTNRTKDLPDIFTLFRGGWMIFKDEAKTLTGLGALMFMGTIVFAGVLGACVIVAVLSFHLASHILALICVFVMAIVTVLVIIGFYWCFAWLMLGTVYAIKSHGSHIGVQQSLRYARPHVWAFMWVNILAGLIALGAWMLFSLAAIIVLSPFYFFLHGVLMPLAMLAFIFAGIVSGVIAATWFGFANWTFIDENGRGLHAIALSKHLSHRHSISIATRVFLIGAIYLIVVIALAGIFSTIFWSLPLLLNTAITKLLTNAVALMVIIPFMYSVFFSLYSDLRIIESVDTDSTAHGEHRGILMTLMVIGLLGVIAFPIVTTAFIAQMRSVVSQEADAQRQASIDSLQNDLQLYYIAHDNLYPNSLVQLTAPGTFQISGITMDLLTDPITGKLYSYQTFNEKQDFKLCAHLSSGLAYCVTNPSHTKAPATTSTSKTASSSPKSSKK